MITEEALAAIGKLKYQEMVAILADDPAYVLHVQHIPSSVEWSLDNAE